MRIDEILVSVYTVPTDAPESDGTLAWDATTMVLVEARAGEVTGLGYTYADIGTAVSRNAGFVMGKIKVYFSALDDCNSITTAR
jgi:hypothetical protein